jgi:hypothetical protein
MTKYEKFDLVEKFIIENREAHYRLAYSYVRNMDDDILNVHLPLLEDENVDVDTTSD